MLPAAGILSYFFLKNPTAESIPQDSGGIEKLSEFLPSRIKGTIPDTSDYFELVKNKKYVRRASVEERLLHFINRKEANGRYYIVYGGKGVFAQWSPRVIIKFRSTTPPSVFSNLEGPLSYTFS